MHGPHGVTNTHDRNVFLALHGSCTSVLALPRSELLMERNVNASL